MHVMLVTGAPACRSGGGPGKFVTMFMEGFARTAGVNGIRLSAAIGREPRTYDLGDAFDWIDGEIAQSPPASSSQIRRLRRFLGRWGRRTFVVGAARLNAAYDKQRRLLKTAFELKKPDLVHCHDFDSVVLLPRDLPVPVLLTSHYKGSVYRESIAPSNPELRHFLWKRYYMGIERRAIRRAERLIFPSESALDLMLEDFPEMRVEIRSKAGVIYTGIPDVCGDSCGTATEISTAGTRVILNISNHIPDKGIANSLHVFAQMFAADKTLRFVNMGSFGPCTSELRALADELGIAGVVEFRGARPLAEAHEALRKALLFLHTPQKVVFDISLLEAMAFAKPVIVTDAKGNIEAVGPGYPFVIPRAAPRLTQHQLDMLANDSCRGEWAERLRKGSLEVFTVPSMVRGYVSLWKSYESSTDNP